MTSFIGNTKVSEEVFVLFNKIADLVGFYNVRLHDSARPLVPNTVVLDSLRNEIYFVTDKLGLSNTFKSFEEFEMFWKNKTLQEKLKDCSRIQDPVTGDIRYFVGKLEVSKNQIENYAKLVRGGIDPNLLEFINQSPNNSDEKIKIHSEYIWEKHTCVCATAEEFLQAREIALQMKDELKYFKGKAVSEETYKLYNQIVDIVGDDNVIIWKTELPSRFNGIAISLDNPFANKGFESSSCWAIENGIGQNPFNSLEEIRNYWEAKYPNPFINPPELATYPSADGTFRFIIRGQTVYENQFDAYESLKNAGIDTNKCHFWQHKKNVHRNCIVIGVDSISEYDSDGAVICFGRTVEQFLKNKEEHLQAQEERVRLLEDAELKAQENMTIKAKEVKPTMNFIKVDSNYEIPKDFTGMVHRSNGTKMYLENGSLHCLTGPALERSDGVKKYYIKGWLVSENQCKNYNHLIQLGFKPDHLVCYEANRVNVGSNLKSDTGIIVFEDHVELVRNGVKSGVSPMNKILDRKAFEDFVSGGKLPIDIKMDDPLASIILTAVEEDLTDKMKANKTPKKVEHMKKEEKEEEKENSMSDTILDTVKTDGVLAATRFGTRKITKVVQKIVVAQMSGHITKKKARKEFEDNLLEFFSSESGKALLGYSIGAMMPFLKKIPLISQYGMVLDMIAQEFRVEGMAVGMDVLVDKLSPGVMTQLESLKGILAEAEKIRVEVANDSTRSSQNDQDYDHTQHMKNSLKSR